MMSIRLEHPGRHRRPRRHQGLPRARQGPGRTRIAIFRILGAWEDEGYKILDRYGVAATVPLLGVDVEAAGMAVAR